MLLAHHDRPHFSGRPSLTGHSRHGWTCSLPHPVAIDTPASPGRHREKGLAPAQAQLNYSYYHGRPALILIAAPFSSRLSRYSVANPFSAVWASVRNRLSEEFEDGVAHGGQGGLRRRLPADFFFAEPLRVGDAGGRPTPASKANRACSRPRPPARPSCANPTIP